jgi:hypothetical protein
MSKEIKCKCCGKKPNEISEYVEMVEDGDYKTAEEAALDDEGTYRIILLYKLLYRNRYA